MSKIHIHPKTLEKIASLMERIPEVVGELSKAAPAPTVSKEAEARAQDLVKHAGLDPTRQAEFANFIQTPEGALKTIGSLTGKIASLQAELEQTRNLSIGRPGSLPSSKAAGVNGSQASAAWCEAILGN